MIWLVVVVFKKKKHFISRLFENLPRGAFNRFRSQKERASVRVGRGGRGEMMGDAVGWGVGEGRGISIHITGGRSSSGGGGRSSSSSPPCH